ncbi:hypothetical protein FE257_006867 [Aspergillus nanangensis]|uniref:Uncharacterized protein n=1 Tax=Aspergillus nanangensis TaxID=2582783 RepID=A0AAD4CNW2_ASPNN|nr:hypothetical protein FE257_006867 [Aspergillus nanangensis]
MPSQPPLPPLLTPYISSLSPSSLTVLSSVLGATGNWLILRFLHAALSTTPGSHTPGFTEDGDVKKRKVVLGLDLARLTDKRQFAFIDGLSELFSSPTTASAQSALPPRPTTAPRTVLPIRSQPSPLPTRSPQPNPRPDNPSPNAAPGPKEAGPVARLRLTGSGTAALDALEQEIISVIKQLKSSTPADEDEAEVLLIVDQPDLLLAATGPSKGIGATEMGEWLMGLQQSAYATVLTLSADSPLLHNASASAHQPATPLETEHAAFAIGSAYRAQMVMQLRTLETGAARDVSGVLRALSYQPSPASKSGCDVGINLVVLGTTGALGGAGLEAIEETTVDLLEVTGTAGTGGLAALGLLTPVDYIKERTWRLGLSLSSSLAVSEVGAGIWGRRLLSEVRYPGLVPWSRDWLSFEEGLGHMTTAPFNIPGPNFGSYWI